MTPSEAPKALQASECSELLDPTRANCWISAQHQPGKFIKPGLTHCDKSEIYSAWRVDHTTYVDIMQVRFHR